ncbi:NAD-dependent epimerase/dehydratase family protein [Mycolicibacterium pulveris]|uniref:NAD-dependent epimerase/dehydratase family protein n=1 Tax=Mycolicibacterium pulveris TaxID=36813 RepID=UPI003CEEBD07
MRAAMGKARGRVLVTGSAGYIGRATVSHLVQVGRSVMGLDRVRAASAEADSVLCDLTTLDDEFDIRAWPQTVIHLAAVCKEPGYPWREYYANNAESTRRLCRAADRAGVDNIIFTSTMMTFAASPDRRSESDFCDPDTAYGGSKLQAEEILRSWQAARPGRRLRIVRPGVVFGPEDEGNMRRLIHALRARRFAYIGRKDTIKGCIYIKDLVRLLVRLIDDDGPHDTFHAVYPNATTIQEIVQAINSAWGWKRRPPTIPYRPALVAAAPFALIDPLGTRFSIHPRRIQKLYQDTNLSADRLFDIGFAPQYSLVEAFADWRNECDGALPK